MIAALWFTGFADLALTAWGLRLGLIEEANPIMAGLFSVSIPFALVTALVVLTAALMFLHAASDHVPWVRQALRTLLAIRLSVLALHLMWIIG